MSKWNTINQMLIEGVSFGSLPKLPGVYVIYGITRFFNNKTILYVGSAKNLNKRVCNHEVIRITKCFIKVELINSLSDYMIVKYKVVNDDHKRITNERKLINKIKPPLNSKICIVDI